MIPVRGGNQDFQFRIDLMNVPVHVAQTFSRRNQIKERRSRFNVCSRSWTTWLRTGCTIACHLLTRTKSAEPAAPTPFRKFRHRELAQQKADTAIAGMAGRTTIPPPILAAVVLRRVPILLPSEAVALVVEIKSAAAVTLEEAVSLSTSFCPLPPVLRAAKASATTAFGKTGVRADQVKRMENQKYERW